MHRLKNNFIVNGMKGERHLIVGARLWLITANHTTVKIWDSKREGKGISSEREKAWNPQSDRRACVLAY